MPTRVLIVDDHPSFKRFASRLLTGAGFVVVGEAADAAEALRETKRLRPDVVLLDVMLPDRSELAVARELTDAQARDMPVIVLISSRSRSDFGESFASVETAAYFVVAEALTNVAKHAAARSAAVSLSRRNGQLVVDISDDGCGGAVARGEGGLQGLAAVGGTIAIASETGTGTRLHAELPCGS